MTRAMHPSEDDMKNLHVFLKYPKGDPHDFLTLYTGRMRLIK